MFRPITYIQFNSLTSIDTFSCLGGVHVTQYTAVGEIPGSNFYVCFFVLLLL